MDAITTQSFDQIGTPLDGTMQARWKEVHEQIQKNIERQQEELRRAPREAFFASAYLAGFTAAQAEFMWNYLAEQGPMRGNGMVG